MTTIQNHITLIGNIGTDTRVVNFENGSKLARFHVFIEKQFRANNGKIRFGKEWHTIFALGNLAKYIESFAQKGKKVAIHGRLVNRTYLTAKGVKKQTTEVELKHIIGL